MLLVTLGFITLAVFVIYSRTPVPGAVALAGLGTMSEQWLAEHRASNPS